jgi:hypothetical protein
MAETVVEALRAPTLQCFVVGRLTTRWSGFGGFGKQRQARENHARLTDYPRLAMSDGLNYLSYVALAIPLSLFCDAIVLAMTDLHSKAGSAMIALLKNKPYIYIRDMYPDGARWRDCPPGLLARIWEDCTARLCAVLGA